MLQEVNNIEKPIPISLRELVSCFNIVHIHIEVLLKLNLFHPRFTNGFVAKDIITLPLHLFAWLRIIRYGSVQKLRGIEKLL